MKPQKGQSLKKHILTGLFVLAFAVGLSVVSSSAARADGGDGGHERVTVNGVNYTVEHDGQGPFIEVNDMKIRLQGDDNNRFVVINGKTFSVTNGHEDHGDNRDHRDEHKDRHDNEKDHRDHGDHKDHHDNKDHHDHKDHKDHKKD